MTRAILERKSTTSRVLTGVVTGLGLAALAYSAALLVINDIGIQWALLSLVTVLLASRLDIGVPRLANGLALGDVLVFIAMLLFGAHPAVTLAGADAAINSLQHKERRRVIFYNAALKSLAAYVSSAAATLIFGDLTRLSADLFSLGLAAAAIAAVHFACNVGLTRLIESLRRGAAAARKEPLWWAAISYVGGALMACIIVKLIDIISFYAFILSVPIAAIMYFTYRVYLDRVETSDRHTEQMADLHLRTIEALAIAIDAKDEVTHDHVHRVQIYATGLARLFGLSELEIEALKAGALLHDVGKLAVPDYILNKPGRLTDAEFEKMKVHTTVGAEILERVGFPYPVVPVVRHHHERWDGRGYPDGLRGDEIPITARILTIADSFDSMREDRQYRKAMTRDEAIVVLKEGAGSVFDPNIVRAFLDQLEDFEAEIRERRVEPQIEAFRRKPGDERGPGAARRPHADSGPVAYEKIRSAHREVLALYNIAQTIGSSLDLRDTFAVFSARLLDIVSYTTCALYLVRQDATEVEAAHVAGRNGERFRGKRIASGMGISGWVVANGHPMHNCDPAVDFEAMKAEADEAYRTATVVPLVKDGEMLGALAVYSAELEAYTPDHLRLMEAVAKLLSDAVANSAHHERTETSALTDMLTGLPNARALRYRFEEESDRARRHRDTFSLMLMDLDGFKAVNDRLGHQAGDQVLRQLVGVMLGQIRSRDFLGRYAGDEFVAILQAGAEEAREAALRLQRAIDKHDFGFNGARLVIGLSIGCASFGADGDSLDELLLAADRAMYSDKARRKGLPGPSRHLISTDSGRRRTA
ncbi:MAG TPA: diguanylate cyclase [Blastocatellia bacterium]|nr:diguanylate cyclase [Blastocatellia bacterium]